MQQLTIEHCHQHEIDLLSELLESHGALSITLTDQYDDPILEPEPGMVPLWPNVVLTALFEETSNIDAMLRAVKAHYPQLACSCEPLPQQDWERTCLVDFKPQRFGNRLWICPSWHTPPDPKAINITLDPGLAFGTGSHHTTSLCLTWLEQAAVRDKTLLDYGCGSGILGIAALKLGARYVHALDIDPQALTATQSNADINAIDPATITVDYPNNPKPTVDIIIANILLKPLLELKPTFYTLLNPDGTLVLSGVLANQTHQLIDHYQSHFTLVTSERDDDWALLVFEKIPGLGVEAVN
jgi:ribosomal protein L11 methyltransferase